ncbi:MAG: ABC transporter ATP-binding protein/permease [Oscillospiraceae bacterium]|nr:ABC transporter ATP-binding protein/permease [Oscillospiraceae bacterium]
MFSVIISVCTVITPYLFGQFIDNIMNLKDNHVIYKYVIILSVVLLVKIFINFFNTMITTKLQWKITFNLNKLIVEHIQDSEYKYLSNMDLTYLNQRICNDCSEVTQFYIASILNLVLNVFILLFSLYIIYTTNIWFLFICVTILIINTFIYLTTRKGLSIRILKFKESSNKIFSSFMEQVRNLKQIKINSIQDSFIKRLYPKYEDTKNNLLSYTKFSYVISAFSTTFNTAFNILVILIGGFLIIAKKLTFGGLTILNNYFNYTYSSVDYFLNFSKTYESYKVCFKRLREISEIPLEENSERIIDHIDKIEIKDLNFSYANKILYDENKSFLFEKNNIYLIKGENGSGKSTFIDLLIGIYSPSLGSIQYNDIDINSLNKRNLRYNLISYATQDAFIFDDTLNNNITFDSVFPIKNEDISELISTERFKEDYILSSNKLSGGEKQRISLFRTLNKNSDLLIMDEPSNSLDKQSICFIKEYLIKIRENKIILLISHDKEFDDITDEKNKIYF